MKILCTVLILGCLVVGYSESGVKPEFLAFSSTDDLTIGLMDWTVKHEDEIIVSMDPNGLVNFLDPNHVSDAVIKDLVKRGRVCKVIGHVWEIRAIDFDTSYTCNVYLLEGRIEKRKCRLCNLTQTKVERWEEVKR